MQKATIQTNHGVIALPKNDLKMLLRATHAKRPGLDNILWENLDGRGRLVATNGHYLLTLDVYQGPYLAIEGVTLKGADIRKGLRGTGPAELEVEVLSADSFPNYRAVFPDTDTYQAFTLEPLVKPTRAYDVRAALAKGAVRYAQYTGAKASQACDYHGDPVILDTAYLAAALKFCAGSDGITVHVRKPLAPVCFYSVGRSALIMPRRF